MRLGADVIRFRIPAFESLTRDLSLQSSEFKVAFNRYLASVGPAAPVKSLQEFIASGGLYEPFREGYERRPIRRSRTRSTNRNTEAVSSDEKNCAKP